MAKSRKNTRKASVKVEDMAPAKNPKGGLLSSVEQKLRDIKRALIDNLR